MVCTAIAARAVEASVSPLTVKGADGYASGSGQADGHAVPILHGLQSARFFDAKLLPAGTGQSAIVAMLSTHIPMVLGMFSSFDIRPLYQFLSANNRRFHP